MKIDKAKLTRCRELREEVEHAEERLLATQPSISARLDPTPRGTKTSNPTEDVALDRVSIEELMVEIIEEYRQLKAEIATACRELMPIYREIIIYRYVDGLDMDEIALKLHYSESYIYTLHHKAVQLITE